MRDFVVTDFKKKRLPTIVMANPAELVGPNG